jgi:predicted nucleic acid-binding protein
MIFLDTNILLYSIGSLPADAAKCKIACDLLDRIDVALSMQVLQEFFHQTTRRSRTDRLTDVQAAAFVEAWQRFPVQVIGIAEIRKAIAIRQRYQLPYWDSAIIAAALAQNCHTLMSEDMQHGLEIEGLRIINPFLQNTTLVQADI